MLRLTLKNLGANKVRFALTTFGVMLAVSFVVSAFVLGDGLRSSFTDVAEDLTANVDLEVRDAVDFGDPEPIAMETVDTVASVDGVADAVPVIDAPWDAVLPIKADGTDITTNGPPQIASNWIENEQLSQFELVDGAPPGLGEFTMDYGSVEKHNFIVGDSYDLRTPSGLVSLVLSGTTSFGEDNATLGAVLMQMNTAEAGEMFNIDGVSNVSVQIEDGADLLTVQNAVANAVPFAEVVDHDVVLAERTDEFTNEIDIVGNILLGFGGVALFVSIFIIYNTFAIVLSQRVRELALLRTIGAAPKQIRRSVMGEALVIGVLASAGGIGGGVVVAKGIEALFGAIGADLPDYPIMLANRTLIAAVVIGIGVTLLAAIGPARKASTIPPIAALRGDAEAGSAGSRTRKVAGTGLLGLGLVTGFIGLSGFGSTSTIVLLMAIGAMSTFLGVTVLSPLAVGFVTSIVGWPMRKLFGVAGHMAQQNAARNERRTASTAAALMIGLALVTTALVVGQSIKSNIGATFDNVAQAELYITDELTETEFPSDLAVSLRDNDIVDASTGFRILDAKVDGNVQAVNAFTFNQIDELLALDITSQLDTEVVNPVMVTAGEAEDLGLVIGDQITTEFSNGSVVEATISAIFEDQAILTQAYHFDTGVLDAAGVLQGDEWIAISTVAGASQTDVDALVATLQDAMPASSIETPAQFQERVKGMVDETLTIVNVMVALAIVIALIGIANTLALSVFERTRELGLIRAVGMTRRQLRRMVRFEAALVATFGAVLGVAIGLVFGFGVTSALPDEFASSVSVPVASIIYLMVIAGVAGVVAAWFPARRAGRMNVLEAIAH